MIDEPYDPTSDRVVRISLAAGLALRGLPVDRPNRLKLAGTALMTIIDPKASSRLPSEAQPTQLAQGLEDVSDVAQLLEQLESMPLDDNDLDDSDLVDNEDAATSTDPAKLRSDDQLNQSVSDEVRLGSQT